MLEVESRNRVPDEQRSNVESQSFINVGLFNQELHMLRVDLVLRYIKVFTVHVLMIGNVVVDSAVSGLRNEFVGGRVSFIWSSAVY